MHINKCKQYEDRFCNECHMQNDVKEVKIGGMVVALCVNCRIKLKRLLQDEDKERSDIKNA